MAVISIFHMRKQKAIKRLNDKSQVTRDQAVWLGFGLSQLTNKRGPPFCLRNHSERKGTLTL